MFSCFKNGFIVLLLNSLPLSDHNFVHFLSLLRMFCNALTTSFAVLFFSGSIQRYLENMSITKRKYLTLSFSLEILDTSAKSISNWSPIPATTTRAFRKECLRSLLRLWASWLCNHLRTLFFSYMCYAFRFQDSIKFIWTYICTRIG